MQIIENAKLAPYTTFYIGGPSRYLIFAQDNDEVVQAIRFARDKQVPFIVFGGGSNLLVADRGYEGVAIRLESVGIDIVEETETTITLKVASGEVWDDVARFACEEGWWGIENLSHIPGFTGAFAVQNVGAYGQEASEVVVSVEVFDTHEQTIKTLPSQELGFSYRKSIFNSSAKGRYVILSTDLKLSKLPQPQLSYGDLARKFHGQQPDLLAIRQAIIDIRNKKFPFPSEPTKGNSGSFFRGRILSAQEYRALQKKVSDVFGVESAQRLADMTDRLQVAQGFKTPTAFLIELCLGKHFVIGGAALNPDQPAIIINHTGQALASEVIDLFEQVQEEVLKKTGVLLEAEPELIGFAEGEITRLKY